MLAIATGTQRRESHVAGNILPEDSKGGMMSFTICRAVFAAFNCSS
jgi:hypothetical protein